jgi:3-hydroxybutyryl-CoA dehydrogenase
MKQNYLSARIGILGMGRMSVGLAIDLALKGCRIDMIDLKDRSEDERRKYRENLESECRSVLNMLEIDADSFLFPVYRDSPGEAPYDLVFEGLPEEIAIKQDAYKSIRSNLKPSSMLCSMTSTFTVEELSRGIAPPLNILVTHFMNPPYLVPFLEVVTPPDIEPNVVEQLFIFLRQAGHMPIKCKSSPGFVISRLQLGLMNEAVRIMEEGVASAEDIDKAITFGWGYRFPVIGILEFIDSGGLDILYHAGRSVSKELNRPDLACPKQIDELFSQGAIGTKALKGIFTYNSQKDVKRQALSKLKKQARIKTLLDQIHKEEGSWA